MLEKITRKIFGTGNDRELKKIQKDVDRINALESKYAEMTDEDLRKNTSIFKERISKGGTLESILPEAFATLRECAKRHFGQRAYDVQLIGGIAMHYGNVAEMRTGEGKTLTATFPSYLNALSGKGVHVITVNDYLASRDAEKMKGLFSKLDITVGCNISGLHKEGKDAAYACDITYGTSNEFGFDYLRDNMAVTIEGKAQRDLNFALIDEVDSVLIDESRTPLIISDDNQESVDYYKALSHIPSLLEEGDEIKANFQKIETGDYYIDLKSKNVHLTEAGYVKIEKELARIGIIGEGETLYDLKNNSLLSIVVSTIKAHTLFQRNKHYIVSDDGLVKIIDEHTGRIMEGRRWNDGLHQAIEAKENVEVKPESMTLATITLQNYFKLYNKLAGMTGTADTEALEFYDTYNLKTIVIPTNRPIQRIDHNDRVYLSFRGKLLAVIEEVQKIHATGQPILLGTSSIEKNEIFYNAIKEVGLNVEVLNAKNHYREAEIIAQAGKRGAITVATNMAGRGTDIILGGNIEHDIEEIENSEILSDETKKQKIADLKAQWKIDHDEVLSLGGLHVIGTERHESRRIDNQLRGRAGRQGDPGSSVFFASFDDDLLKPYADKIKRPFQMLNISEFEVLEGKLLNRQVSGSQQKVEKMHYEARKNLMDFDETVSLQRAAIYSFRKELLEKDIRKPEDIDYLNEYFDSIINSSIEEKLEMHCPKTSVLEDWDLLGLIEDVKRSYDILLPITPTIEKIQYNESDEMEVVTHQIPEKRGQIMDSFIYGDIFDALEIHEKITHFIKEIFKIKIISIEEDQLLNFKKVAILQIIDKVWREHLTELDLLKQGIHLRTYAQKDPKIEYKKEAYAMFQGIIPTIQNDFTEMMMNVNIVAPPEHQVSPHEIDVVEVSQNQDEINKSE